MKKFTPYIVELRGVLEAMLNAPNEDARKGAMLALDGQPNQKLRELVDLQDLRSSGAFFTTSSLRDRMVKKIKDSINEHSIIYDPSCGAGDLLIACSDFLPIGATVEQTLQIWGQQLHGIDIHEQFIEVAKVRLLLAAITRHRVASNTPLPPVENTFANIRVGNGLKKNLSLQIATHLLLNPPYHQTSVPKREWGSGLVSTAAIFVDHCLEHGKSGSILLSLLPDVLRSGSRYEKWRQRAKDRLRTPLLEERCGQFDAQTDVDVYIYGGIIDRESKSLHPEEANGVIDQETVSNHFRVSVGTVVPHRDKETCTPKSYLCARQLMGHSVFETDSAEQRSFPGSTIQPPFVVVRRTSRPHQGKRINGTLITGSQATIVENHLIVLTPNSGLIADCQTLLRILKSPKAEEWMNNRICCRHLTVTALREVPWVEEQEL